MEGSIGGSIGDLTGDSLDSKVRRTGRGIRLSVRAVYYIVKHLGRHVQPAEHCYIRCVIHNRCGSPLLEEKLSAQEVHSGSQVALRKPEERWPIERVNKIRQVKLD